MSDALRRAALLLGGLWCLNISPAVWAASEKPSGKPVASQPAKVAKKPVKQSLKASPKAKRPAASSALTPELGAANILDTDLIGLHGSASFYGQGFQGRRTASGERFDVREFTAASNHFPLGTLVAVRRLDNDRCAIVKVNDRMAGHRRRIIDVSRGVAEYLDMIRAGVVLVRAAPMKDAGADQDQTACHAAFEPENDCDSCGRPLRLPEFGEAGSAND